VSLKFVALLLASSMLRCIQVVTPIMIMPAMTKSFQYLFMSNSGDEKLGIDVNILLGNAFGFSDVLILFAL